MKILSSGVAAATLLPIAAVATENLPQIPFAEAVRLPESKQWVVTPWYAYSVFRKLWIGSTKVSIETQSQIDFEMNDGMVRLEYGLTDRWALDATVGYTSAATRAWNPKNHVETTQGLMDSQLGLRYSVLDEHPAQSWYVPTLTARLGAIIRGTYDVDFPMAPGDGASGFEASLLMTKTFGKFGLGAYADVGYRLRSNHVPQTVFGSAGLSETIKLDWKITSVIFYAGYRGLYDLNGSNLSGERVAGPPHDFVDLNYSRHAQEIYHLGELGIGLTDQAGRRYFLSASHPFEGQNTGKVNNFIIGVNWPL